MLAPRFLLAVTLSACLLGGPCKAGQLLSDQIEYGTDYYAEDWPPEKVCATGENRRSIDQARPVLLAALGRESSDAVAAWG